MAGSGGIVVMDEDTDIVAVCARIMRFRPTSRAVGCTPCRRRQPAGSKICTRLADGYGQPGDVDLLSSIAYTLATPSVRSVKPPRIDDGLSPFRPDFEARLASRAGELPPLLSGAHP